MIKTFPKSMPPRNLDSYWSQFSEIFLKSLFRAPYNLKYSTFVFKSGKTFQVCTEIC